MIDPVELAKNVHPVSEREWIDVCGGLVYVTCGHCGHTHSLEVKDNYPGAYLIRIAHDQDVTDACRERNEYPLYQEVLGLREQYANLKRQLEEAERLAAARNKLNGEITQELDLEKARREPLLRLVQTMGKLDARAEELLRDNWIDPDIRFGEREG